MVMEQATTVRREWSSICDSVIHEKPKFIKRTRDKMCLANLSTMMEILDAYKFTATELTENDGSVTLSLNEIDLVANGSSKQDALDKLSLDIMEYAAEYYEEYEAYSHAPNRKGHVPYVLKALILNDEKEIGKQICLSGAN